METTLERINSIPHLTDLIHKSIILMITMHDLPYLEEFYKHYRDILTIEIVNRDLLHIFTNLLINDMAGVIRLKNNGLLHIGRFSMQEAIFNYICAIAKLINSSQTLPKIKEEEIFKTNDPKLLPYQKFFLRQYNPLIFKNEDNFRLLNLSRENCFFIQRTGEVENYSYSFIHQLFLDYFATLSLQSINGRRKTIEIFMKDYHVGDLSPQSLAPLSFDSN